MWQELALLDHRNDFAADFKIFRGIVGVFDHSFAGIYAAYGCFSSLFNPLPRKFFNNNHNHVHDIGQRGAGNDMSAGFFKEWIRVELF